MKSKFTLPLKGRTKDWSPTILASEEEAKALREDGIDLWRIQGTVPTWLPPSLTYLWLRVQDVWNFLRLW